MFNIRQKFALANINFWLEARLKRNLLHCLSCWDDLVGIYCLFLVVWLSVFQMSHCKKQSEIITTELTYSLRAYRSKENYFATRHHQPLLGDQIFLAWSPCFILLDLEFDDVWTSMVKLSSKLFSWQPLVTVWCLRFCEFEFGKAVLRMVFVCSAPGSNIRFGHQTFPVWNYSITYQYK